MLGEIRQLTQEQFASLLERPWKRDIIQVHIHHTWRPTHTQWRGERTVKAIRDFHVQTNGWSDIAQHLTIGPDGSLWTGRHLDRAPASATGHNGSSAAGPFMIEMVGDFDEGRDPFEEPGAGGKLQPTKQAQAAYDAVASICGVFDIPVESIFFHRDLTGTKTCPGTSIALTPFRTQVAAKLKGRAAPRSLPAEQQQASDRYLMFFAAAGSATRDGGAVDEGEPGYSGDQSAWFDAQGKRDFLGGRDFSEPELELFRQHVLNLQMGRLSDSGDFSTSPADLDALIEHIATWLQAKPGAARRIVFYAHGGLIDEGTALREIVLRDVSWWIANDVYPVFFVWETGINEVYEDLREHEGARGLTDITDAILEKTLGPLIGRPTWRRIKNNALLSSGTFANGDPGGATLFIEQFVARLDDLVKNSKAKQPELHAVGHSAGAIFHYHFLPALAGALGNIASLNSQPAFETFALLAPAGRVDDFARLLAPMVQAQNPSIGRLAVFTIFQSDEEADNVIHIYRKSLLYFVRNACEEGRRPPILGLEESIRADAGLVALFGLGGGPAAADIIWSPTPKGSPPRSACTAIAHGDFDDNGDCMNSVLRRILNIPDAQALPRANIGKTKTTHAQSESESDSPFPSSGDERAVKGKRAALCIGIDDYPSKPLQGCVADANAWGAWFSSAGFSVKYLTEAKATRSAILREMRAILDRASRGDVVAIQFAGHGTQVKDVSGDEGDRLDEAWVPHDYAQGEFVLDDDIGALFERYRASGVDLVVFTDCCHSGSNTRLMLGPEDPRRAPNSRLLEVSSEISDRFVARQKQRRDVTSARKNDDVIGWEIHFAGCQDDQSSYEENGHGKFTTAALKALRQASTYGALADTLRTAFNKDRRQSPNFRALADRRGKRVFGGASGAPAREDSPASGEAADSMGIEIRLDAIERRIEELAAGMGALKRL